MKSKIILAFIACIAVSSAAIAKKKEEKIDLGQFIQSEVSRTRGVLENRTHPETHDPKLAHISVKRAAVLALGVDAILPYVNIEIRPEVEMEFIPQ